MLSGSTYDDTMHKASPPLIPHLAQELSLVLFLCFQLKMAIGAEDPTLWERVKSSLEPRESLGDKVRHLLGQDTGVTRENLYERATAALSALDPRRRETVMEKVTPVISQLICLFSYRTAIGPGFAGEESHRPSRTWNDGQTA